jgi:hypothetical protein
MATLADVRKIAMALPEVHQGGHGFGFGVMNKGKPKGFVWSWKERVEPKKPRVENLEVMAIRVRNLAEREAILASSKKKFFTEPHYNGFPAVLVRLKAIPRAELKILLEDAWRCLAPKHLLEKS